MALSETELLEMIESTITANGAKEITGASLNAALTAIVEAMGTGNSGGGASTEQIYTDFSDGTGLTEDQKAINAATYAKAKAAYEQGSAMPIINIDATLLYSGLMGTTNMKFNLLANNSAYFDPSDPTLASEGIVGLMVGFMAGGSSVTCIIQEDGSCVAQTS